MSQFRSFAIFLLALSGASAVDVNSKCEPTCEGVTESGTQVMDPSSCVGYYVCALVGEEFVLSERQECNDGYFFNIDLVVPQCDDIAGAHDGFCEGYCNPCEVQCSEPGTLRPDPLDCGNYYLCLEEGASQQLSCGPLTDQYFDYTEEACQSDESLCYNYCDQTKPYCVETGFVVPVDPPCAEQYYYCDPPTLTPFSCPTGQCFDPETGSC